MAGFAKLGTTEPDFYRGSATGIPRNKEGTRVLKLKHRPGNLRNLEAKKYAEELDIVIQLGVHPNPRCLTADAA